MENRNQNNSFENSQSMHSSENSNMQSNQAQSQSRPLNQAGSYNGQRMNYQNNGYQYNNQRAYQNANQQRTYQHANNANQQRAYQQGPSQNGQSGMPPYNKQSVFSQTFIKLFIVLVLAFAGGIGGAYVYTNFLGNTITSVDPSTTTTTSTNATEVAKKMSASVVAITTEKMSTYNYGYGNEVSSGAGSGVIYTKDGYIVTCAHVVDGASKIVVTTSDQQQYSATLIGSDSSQDIAVLKIDATDLTPATFADSSKIAQGSTTYAVGNPEGRLSNSITSGIISATSRSIEVATGSNSNSMYQNTIKLTVIQTDAAVSPGNSGGGLFDAKGNLIGLVSAKSVQSGSEGLAFAIHSNTVKTIAQKLMK